MGKMVFITGGARSGKSSYALRESSRQPGKKVYIATMQPLDEELVERVKMHRAERGAEWDTIEEPVDLTGALLKLDDYDVILIDCLTLWLSNLMMRDCDIEGETIKLLSSLKEFSKEKTVFIVSNEVGMGIVPETGMGRRFRDMAGMLNGKTAAASDEAYLMVSGLPVKIK